MEPRFETAKPLPVLALLGTIALAAAVYSYLPRSDGEGPPNNAVLEGTWTGEYAYSDADAEKTGTPLPTVSFEITFRCDKVVCRGTSVEPNTFGGKKEYRELRANWEGNVRGNRVSLRKTYDGTGGASHTVTYDGKYSSGNQPTIDGKWLIEPSSTGPFSMRKN